MESASGAASRPGRASSNTNVITRFLEDHVPAGARVLDAGCGPGRFALQCLARGCRLTLVDLSDAMLDEARQRIREAGLDGTHRCSYLDLEALPPGGFDAALCLGGSLNYMPERIPEALAALRRLLRPGGILVGSVMNTLGTFHLLLAQGRASADDALDAAGVRLVWDRGALEVSGRWISEHRARMFERAGWTRALEAAAFETVAESASECLLALPTERLDALRADPATWAALLRIEVEACRRAPEAGAHLLFAARRPGGR